ENPYYGGGGGGGYTNSQNGSQDSPGGKKKSNTSTIRPVTVKQILDASQPHPDSDFAIDGYDVGQVLLVGSVRAVSKSATNVQVEIGDGTGYIDARLWLDSAEDESEKAKGIEQDKYVGIMGSIKLFGGKRHISASHIRLIEDLNEVYNHLLKALYVSLTLRNPGTTGQAHAHAPNNDYNAPVGMTTTESPYANLPPLQRKIMEIVSKEESEDGMHVSAVSRSMTGTKGEDVMEAIENLMGEGMLYSTVDD
ncbi:hypothetical protein TREMEDRAFT_18062, partial [Tremella mesenterica DSM 1558]|uniref:uncharacterized protein n=1 Tax=Tremella mesenterica (strain ATCC 24925 / CBS 8224 / DSM 1558 / NBRC 9311 / NRRL Y-6157 / RJB 2259-6 / UBC 559-6) TaxID=578456 RepID=UPI0003F49D40